MAAESFAVGRGVQVRRRRRGRGWRFAGTGRTGGPRPSQNGANALQRSSGERSDLAGAGSGGSLRIHPMRAIRSASTAGSSRRTASRHRPAACPRDEVARGVVREEVPEVLRRAVALLFGQEVLVGVHEANGPDNLGEARGEVDMGQLLQDVSWRERARAVLGLHTRAPWDKRRAHVGTWSGDDACTVALGHGRPTGWTIPAQKSSRSPEGSGTAHPA